MLTHVTNLMMAYGLKDVLIVAPLSALSSWKRDIELLSPIRKKLCEGITLINYDKVWRRKEYNKHWDCIVLDEAHAIAHRNSKRSKFLLSLSEMSEYRYILTGTPIANYRLEDFYPLMSFLKPNILGTYKEFAAHYLIERQLPSTFVKIIVGYRNQEELLNLIGSYSLRITKEECLDLPEMLPDVVIECELKEKKIYKQALKDFVSEFEMTIGNPLTKVMKLRQIPSGFIVDEFGELHPLKSDKINLLDELLDSILPRKIVIFCEFKHSMKEIENLLNKKKITFVKLNGEQKNKGIWTDFQRDPSIQVIICQYQTANSGIDLFSSSHMVFYEPNLSTTVIEQSRGRIHRNGQKSACSYYWLVTKDTIEFDIYNRLKNKSDFNKSCLNEIANRNL